MNLMRPRLILAVALACACTVRAADAQLLTGTITGTVKDQTGGVLPGVTVTLVSDWLFEGPRETATNEFGAYRFDRLVPGRYDLSAALSGFKAFTREAIDVSAVFVATVDLTLSVGPLGEVVRVSGDSPVVDTRTTVQQTIVGQTLLEGLPTGRDPWAIARLLPGVVPSVYDVGGTAGMQQAVLTVHGSRASDQTYAVDGVLTNYPGSNGGSSGLYFDQGMFEEINYQTSGLPAEVATGGLYINMVTKAGGSRWRGEARGYVANESTQSNNFEDGRVQYGFAVGNPITSQYDGNVTAGGPLADKWLSFFGSFRRWSVDKRLLAVFNPDGTTAIDDNLIWSSAAKVTGQFGPSHRVATLIDYTRKYRYHRRDAIPLFVEDKATSLQDAFTVVGQVRYTGVINARTLVESAFGFMDGDNPARYQPDVGPTDLRREDTVLNTATGAGARNLTNPFRRLQLDHAISYSRSSRSGEHVLRAGLQYNRQRFEERSTINGDIRLIYQNNVATRIIAFNTPVEAKSSLQQMGLFVQDTWPVAKRLTLNLGGRLDRANGWIPAQTNAAGRWVAARAIERRDVYDQWIGVWRLGAVVDLTGQGRTAAKVSYSRYGQQAAINLVSAVHPFSSSQADIAWSDMNGNGLPEATELGTFQGFTGGATTRYASANGPRWAYSDEIVGGIEHQLSSDLRAGLTYFHRENRDNLGTRNVAVPTSGYSPIAVSNPLGGTLTLFNLDPAFLGRQDSVRDNTSLVDSDYDGVEIVASKRWTGRWQALLGFTGGRSLTGLDAGDLNDPNNLQFQQGSQLDDIRWQWRAAGSYRVPRLDVMVSGTLLHNTGFPRQYTLAVPRAAVPSLTRATQTLRANRRGDVRRPGVTLFDLRVSRSFRAGRLQLEPQLDIFNVANAATVIGLNDAIGPTLNRPSEILPPRIARLGFVVTFD